ncbi:mechanosensitive ion channel family protein [Maridesulfovibrio sp. FT414]|uniref:mechanosensitive ion channel family protein n=1 Tax=Maridesulfovibrio sp. FT414 TaxID=2979469 RepID=UPI003D80514D
MNRSTIKFLALALAGFIFFGSSISYSAESSEDTWRSMIVSLESDIAAQTRMVQELDKHTPAMIDLFDRQMLKAQSRLDQLKMLRGLAKGSPWSYRTVLMQLDAVESYIELAKSDLLTEKNRLRKIKRDFDVLAQIHFKSKITDTALIALLQSAKSQYLVLRDDAASLKKNIDSALDRADELNKGLQEDRRVTQDFYAQTMHDFYFSQGLSLLSPENWPDITYAFHEWNENYSKFYHPLIVWVQWGKFLAFLTGFTVLLWVVLRNLVSHLLKRSMFSTHRISYYNSGLLLISLGFGVYAARMMTLFTSNQITGLIWTEAITLGVIICSRNFLWAREKAKPAPLILSPMFTLWCLMTAGDILHMLTIPMDCLGIIWFFLSLGGLAFIHANRRVYNLSVTRATSKASRFILGAGSFVTLFGFGSQAMILTQIWLLFLVTLQICTALKTIMITDLPAVPEHAQSGDDEESDEELIRHAEEARQEALHHNRMVQLFYPLSVSVIIFLFIGWATAYMGGMPFAKFVFRHMDIKVAGADISIKSIFYILILFFTARLVLFWLNSFVNSTSIGGRRIESSLAHTLSTIGSYIVWVVFLLSSFSLMGIPMSALTWIASGLSIGVGFGLKDIVSNFVSGLIILFGGSIKKGDTLQHKNLIGKVVDVSIRNTTMRTLDNSMIIIPNSSFLKGEIINLNYQDTRIRVTIPVTLAPGTKIKKATKVMMKVLSKHPNILKEPEPVVFFKRFGNFGLDFEIYFWVNNFEDKYPTESDIINELDEKFQDKKIMVAFRGIKIKYKPKGDEQAQLASQREALKEKRRIYGKCLRSAALRKHRTLNKIEIEKPE